MKKLLLIALLLIVTLLANAETHYYKSVSFNSKLTGGEWSGWRSSNIPVTINFDTRHVEISSATPQIIDYTGLTEKTDVAYSLYSGSATDRKYTLIGISFQVFTYGTFYLTIQYDDCVYSYSLIEN